MKLTKYEIVHDKVRIRDKSSRQWLVYDAGGRLRAECTDEQQAKDFVAIERAKQLHLKTT